MSGGNVRRRRGCGTITRMVNDSAGHIQRDENDVEGGTLLLHPLCQKAA